jgi:hypothetical protein
MDYGELIRRSWTLTWRYRFLWIFGFFATTTVGSCPGGSGSGSGWRTDGREIERFVPGAGGAERAFVQWLGDNLGLIIALGALAALIGLAVLLLSIISQGAMARATADVARGRTSSLREAWQVGLANFWRYLGLWLLLIVVGIAVAAMFAIPAVIAVVAFAATDGGVRTLLLVLGGFFVLMLVLLLIPIAIAVSVVVAYAQRSIVVENIGPLAALRSGFWLLRGNLGQSALAWLVNLALSIGAGIAIAIAAAVMLIPLGAIAFILHNSTGFSPGTIAYTGVAVVVFILAFWVLTAIMNTYFWNYWTLIYLRLSQRLPGEGNRLQG